MRESLIPEYNVLCASNGKEALDLLGKFNTDLIVSDVMMDTMDGYELLKSVRENDQMKGIPLFSSPQNPEFPRFWRPYKRGYRLYRTHLLWTCSQQGLLFT